MNERVKQLMDQAGIDVEAVENLGEMPTALKFAELIVQECSVALSPMLRDMVSRGQAFDLIRQHFGVEE